MTYGNIQTAAVHAGARKDDVFGAINEPIYLTSNYRIPTDGTPVDWSGISGEEPGGPFGFSGRYPAVPYCHSAKIKVYSEKKTGMRKPAAVVAATDKRKRGKHMREMRRNRQEMTKERTEAVLRENTNGVLSVSGEDGYPYGVPVSFVYRDGCLYFHMAKEGHKIDAIREYPKVCFTVVDEDTVMGAEYTTYFRSAVVFGEAEIVTEEEERRKAFLALAEKYSREESDESKAAVIERGGPRAAIVRIRPVQMTGKEAIEYVKRTDA